MLLPRGPPDLGGSTFARAWEHRFSQEILRQVAYETLSRRDRTARLASVGHDADADADPLFGTAVASLRENSTPYRLVHGLLDHAEHRRSAGHDVDELVDEARAIAER
ncbi:hypothetical protein [Ilumatobacter sp.]|uniref:hypothetical protein n=1 Tax=Ilumatobacter sp. TaxID=1967498 RepID=UPI003C59FF00